MASKITDETRPLIAGEPSGIPFQHIADKYGVSWYFVRKTRRKAGCPEPPPTGRGKHGNRYSKQATAIEIVPPEIVSGNGSLTRHYDAVIGQLEEQVALYTQALETVRGLRDTAE